MRPVYDECIADRGTGVTKRSLDRIEEALSKKGSDSPFAVAARRISAKLNDTDFRHMAKDVQPRVDKVLRRLFASVDSLLDNEVVDEAEVVAKKDLQGLLPVLMSDYKQACTDFQAVKSKYAPKGGELIVLD